MKNRYMFFKRLFKEYVIIFKDNKSFKIDKKLIKYIKNGDINYLIVDNDNNFIKYESKKNNYKYYVIKEFLKEII